MSLIGWIFWGVVGLAALVLILSILGNRPAYYRRKPAGFVEDMVAMLAAQPEGSFLIMEHNGSDRFLQFRKPKDTGRREQEVVFEFPEVSWTRAFFEKVVEEVAHSGRAYEIVARAQEGETTRFLEVTLEGDRLSLGREAAWLIKPLLPIMGFSDRDRFTFHADAPHWDPELQARVEIDFWRQTAAAGPAKWVRRYAEKKVELGRPKED